MDSTINNKNYLELWLTVEKSQEDLWSAFCFDMGASGIETLEEQKRAVQVRVFFENHEQEFVETLPKTFCERYSLPSEAIQLIKVEAQPYEDWQSNWKEYFLPVDIGQSFTVCPPWKSDAVAPDKFSIVIDPGQGFGTGYHPSTVLALETLEQAILQQPLPPESMADVGIGSGILSIAAAHLGVPRIHGVDIEATAIEDVVKNQTLNGWHDRIQAWAGGPELLKEAYSLVISNMLYHELLGVKRELANLVAPTGVLICSGLLKSQQSEFIQEFFSLNMTVKNTFDKEGWVALIMVHS